MLLSLSAFAQTYDLETLVSSAFSNSHELRALEKEMLKADAQISEARGNAFPDITISANLAHSFNQFTPFSMPSGEQVSLVDTMFLYGIDPQSNTGRGIYTLAGTVDHFLGSLGSLSSMPDNSGSLSLTVNQALYAQGKVGIGVRIGSIYQSILRCRHREAQLKLRGEITTLFYASVIAQKAVGIRAQALELAQETHQLARVNFSVGSGSELDTLKSRLYLETAGVEYQQASSDLKLSYEVLMLHSGINRDVSQFSIAGTIPEINFDLTIQQATERMYKNNPMVNYISASSAIAQEMVSLARSDFRPLVYGGLSVSKIGQFDNFRGIGSRDNWFDDQKVYIGLSWNVFSGMQKMYKLNQAKYDMAVTEITETQALEGLELQLKMVYERLVTSRERLKSTESIVALAQRGYSVANRSFQVGQISLIELRNTELELNKARTAHNATLFAYHSALIELKVLMGEHRFE